MYFPCWKIISFRQWFQIDKYLSINLPYYPVSWCSSNLRFIMWQILVLVLLNCTCIEIDDSTLESLNSIGNSLSKIIWMLNLGNELIDSFKIKCWFLQSFIQWILLFPFPIFSRILHIFIQVFKGILVLWVFFGYKLIMGFFLKRFKITEVRQKDAIHFSNAWGLFYFFFQKRRKSYFYYWEIFVLRYRH